MKIAFFEIENWEESYIKKNFKGHKMKFFRDELTERNAKKIKGYDAISIFIYSKIDKKILGILKNLKLICTMSTGFDHIDLEECRKRKIAACNVPYYGENTVAEHAFGLILGLSKQIVNSVERTRKDYFNINGLMGFDLKGKTLGIIGVGHIGLHVIKMAKGFEMNVIGFTPHPKKSLEKKFKFKYVSFDKLLSDSDIITLHVPLTKHTYHIIAKEQFKKMKKGVYIINTARGGLINTRDLLWALEKNIVAGAGIDALESETYLKEEKQLLHKKFVRKDDWQNTIENHLLLKRKDVLITPHSAFYTKEALLRIIDTSLDNIKNFIKKKPSNKVR